MEQIDEISRKYKYHGFWLKGRCTWEGEEVNPYIYFPSEEVSRSEMLSVLDGLDDSEFEPKVKEKLVSFEDGDEVNLPVSVDGKCTISTEILYNSDGPYSVVYFEYKGYENENEIVYRIFCDVVDKSHKNYVERNYYK